MDHAALLHVFALHAAVVITPGPNFIVVAHAASESRPAGLWTAAGVAVGAVAWALAATLGFAAVAKAAPDLYTLVRLGGYAYLAWLAIRILRRPARGRLGAPTEEMAARHAFARGLLTNLANPKSLIFFGSVLSVALPSDAPAALRLGVVTVIAGNALVWYSTVALVLAGPRLRGPYERHRADIDRLAGVAMLVLASSVVLP